MPLLGLVLAVGTAGMTMGVDLSGSKWHPSFMTASEIPSGVHMTVQFGPDGGSAAMAAATASSAATPFPAITSKIGPLGSSRKGCPGLTQVETSFFATLEAAKSFEQNDTTLTLFDAAGDKLAQFVRAEEK